MFCVLKPVKLGGCYGTAYHHKIYIPRTGGGPLCRGRKYNMLLEKDGTFPSEKEEREPTGSLAFSLQIVCVSLVALEMQSRRPLIGGSPVEDQLHYVMLGVIHSYNSAVRNQAQLAVKARIVLL